jgi:hypothetical protein
MNTEGSFSGNNAMGIGSMEAKSSTCCQIFGKRKIKLKKRRHNKF